MKSLQNLSIKTVRQKTQRRYGLLRMNEKKNNQPCVGMKPRIKNHFRAHQLSIWLRLIPELHRAGMEDVITRHNLFKNHDDMDLYDGPVKLDSLSRLAFLEETFKQRRNNGTNNEYSLLNINGKCSTVHADCI